MGWGEERKPRITGEDFQEALREAVRAGKVRILARRELGPNLAGVNMVELDLELVED